MRVVILLADQLNLTKVSDMFGVSQPALSRQLKRIERILNQILFIRLSRGLKLTPAGHIFVDSFRQIVETYEFSLFKARNLDEAFGEEISIGIHPVIGACFLPSLEPALDSDLARLVSYKFDHSRKVVDSVLEGSIDFGIVADPKSSPDLVIKILWKDCVGLFSEDGKERETILINEEMINGTKIISSLDFSYKRVMNNYGIICDVVQGGKTAALLPRSTGIFNGLKQIKAFEPAVNISLVYRSDRKKTKVFRALKSAIMESKKPI